MAKYEYEYYLVSQKWPNTNIFRLPRNDRLRIRISFCFPIMTENKYHLAFHKWSTKYKYKLCRASQKEGLQDQFWVSQGGAKLVDPSIRKVKKRWQISMWISIWMIGAHLSKVSMLSKTRLSYNCAHLRSAKESLTFFILTLGGTGWYLVVLGQYRTVGVDIW